MTGVDAAHLRSAGLGWLFRMSYPEQDFLFCVLHEVKRSGVLGMVSRNGHEQKKMWDDE